MYLQNVTFLSESNGIRRTTILQAPVSDRLHPGDSVTLHCSVISQICAGEYSIYWFRHSSGRSDPGIIYTHDNSSDQCMKRSESGSFRAVSTVSLRLSSQYLMLEFITVLLPHAGRYTWEMELS